MKHASQLCGTVICEMSEVLKVGNREWLYNCFQMILPLAVLKGGVQAGLRRGQADCIHLT